MKLPFCTLAGHLRRWVLLAAGLLFVLAPAWATHSKLPIRIGFPVSLFHEQYLLISDWRQYLENKLKRPVQLVVYRQFSTIAVQLKAENLDFAWVTDYPDVQSNSKVRLLAVPLRKGRPYFTSYLIVPASNHKTTSLLQLKGAVFVFTDPSQNGSYMEVQHELLTAGENPAQFFSKVFFTQSHHEVIKAVTVGLAHAGAVDSNVWDSLALTHPELTAQTRIVAQSHEYGAPPLVANHFIGQADFNEMQSVLLGMAADAKGIELLKRLGLDGFIPGDQKIYERTVKIRQLLGEE